MDEPVHIFESKTDLDNVQLVPPATQSLPGLQDFDHRVAQDDYSSDDSEAGQEEADDEDDFDEVRERIRLIVKLDRIKYHFGGGYPFITKLIPEFDVLYKLPISRLRLMVEEALAAVSASSSENAVKGFIAAGASALEAIAPLVGLDASGLTNAVTHPDNKGMQDLIKEACIKYDSLTSTPVELRIAMEIMRTIKELDRYNKERRSAALATSGRGGNREQEVVTEETLEKAKDL